MELLRYFVWRILLIFIFLRPFLSEYAFLTIGFWYVSTFIFFLLCNFILNRASLFVSSLNFSIFLFIITILISIIFSGFTGWSIYELYLFIPNILIFYVVSNIKPTQRKELISIIFLASIVISIYAIYQYFIGFRHLFEYIKQTFSHTPILPEFVRGRRVFATFISPNIFAGYIVMMLFLEIGFLISLDQKRIIYWVSIPIILMSLILTKSLGGILTFVITFLLFIFYITIYLLPHLGFKKTSLRKVKLGIISTLFIFIVASIPFLWHRLPQSFNLNNPNNSIIQRFYYWKASLNMIKDFPFIGIGWRKFGLLYECYKPLAANISHYSHNVFLQITAEMGLLGLLSFLCIVFIFLQTGVRVIKNSNEQQGLKIGLFCAGCSFLFYNLIDLSFYFGQVSFFWWMILGLFSGFSSKNA